MNNLADSGDAIEPQASDHGATRIADVLTLTGLVIACLPPAMVSMLA
ncbi:hypothetical protein [Cupriavidus sp. D39]|nr:hypothetical protein [Cupriavidus sp. D39]MCY0853301.1 hypothetical protein [Cupriavidus sp. D39]